MAKVAAAVEYAHSRRIIHRDLKPANILLTRDGEPKVSDFGLAKRIELESDLTTSGQVVGTPNYMPPEQALGLTEKIGPWSDIYSLGAVLYHLVTGRPPFQAASFAAILRQLMEDDPVPPRQLNSAVDVDLETICLRCLEKEPERRYPSAAAVQDDLNRFLLGETIQARRTPLVERAWKWSRRRPTAALLLVVSVIAIFAIATGGWFYAEMANQRTARMGLELEERKSLEAARREADQLIARSEQALAAGNSSEARVLIEKALATIGDSESLTKERQTARELATRIEGLRVVEGDRAAARARFEQFNTYRNQALFYGSQFFGLDPRQNQMLAQQAASNALALYQLDRDVDLPTAATTHYSPEEVATLRTRCYELLLVLADSLVQSASDSDKPQALRTALETINRANQLNGRPTQAAQLQRADHLAALHDPTAAQERDLANSPELAPATAADFFLLGKLWLQAAKGPQELTLARSSFERALRVDAQHFWSQYCLGMCNLRLRRPDLAQVHFTSCISQRPDFAWTYVLRGSAQSQLKEFALAESDFAQVFELPADEEARYVALVNWGVMEYEREQGEQAEVLLKRAIELRPAQFQAYVSLAKVLQQLLRVPEARQTLDAAIQLQPEMALIYRERARLLIQSKDLGQASVDLEKAIALQPQPSTEKADDLTRLGEIRIQQRQLEAALTDFERALQAAPEYSPAQLWKGVVLVEQKKYSAALTAFDAYEKQARPAAEFYSTRGLCRASLSKYPEAIADFTRAIELSPTAAGYCKRGWLYVLRGNPLIALSDFERAIELEPQSVDGRCGRGLALARLGRTVEAVADVDQFLAAAPATPQVLYKAGCILAVASLRSVEATNKSPRQAAELRQEYRRRAFALLERAVELELPENRGRFWSQVIEKDIHLQSLQDSAEFQRLRNRLVTKEARATPTKTQAASAND
jgi:tetratricopeptide (TPR) repeat protein